MQEHNCINFTTISLFWHFPWKRYIKINTLHVYLLSCVHVFPDYISSEQKQIEIYLWADRRVYTQAPGLEQGPRPHGNGCTTHLTREGFGAPAVQLLVQDTQQRNTSVLNLFRQLPRESTLKHDSFPLGKAILIGLAWPGAATDRAHMIFLHCVYAVFMGNMHV